MYKLRSTVKNDVYALDPSTLRESVEGYRILTEIEGVRVMRKKGVFTVSCGTLRRSRGRNDPLGPTAPYRSFQAFLDAERIDGGSLWDKFIETYRWDGSIMKTPNDDYPLADLVTASQQLDPILQALPNVPPNLQGWYAWAGPREI